MSASALFYTEDMQDIADICGHDVALELLQKLPGVEIKVPLHWSAENPLARISREAADKIIEAAPGTKFYVPTRTDRASKTKARQLHGEGKSTLDIALELHVSERYVRMLLQGRKALPKPRKVDDRQVDLEDFLNRSNGL